VFISNLHKSDLMKSTLSTYKEDLRKLWDIP
jgi:hypothetical protein